MIEGNTSNTTSNTTNNTSSSSTTQLMPVLGWGLDPLLSSSRKVFIKTIRKRCKYDTDVMGVNLVYYYDRPVLKVEVVGILVSRRIVSSGKSPKVYLWVDDGTGVIMCMQPIDINKPYYQSITIGCLVSVKGSLILLETNDNPYGWVIRIQSVDVFDDPNKEALYWASSLLLHQSDYTQPYQCTKHQIEALDVSYPDILQYCTCCNTSSSSSSSSLKKYIHVKEKLLYCKCLANQCHPDPWCDFRIFFLLYLLSRENVTDGNEPLELGFDDIISDTTIKQKAIDHLDDIKTYHDEEVNGLYHSCPPPSYVFNRNTDDKSAPSSSSPMQMASDNIDDNMMTVEILIQIVCKSLVSDGILCDRDGRYTLLSIERFLIPLIRKLYDKDTNDNNNNKKRNVFQAIHELKLNIPVYKLEYCYSKFNHNMP